METVLNYLQLLVDSPLSANYVVILMAAIIGFLAIRILNRIEKMLDAQQKELVVVRKFIAAQDEKNKNYDKNIDVSAQITKTLDSMYTKLKAMQG